MSPSATSGPLPSRQTMVNGGRPVSAEHTSIGGAVAGKESMKGVGKAPVYKRLEELNSTRPTNIDRNTSIRKLIKHGEDFAKYADTQVDFRRPDLAYQAHIQASVIASELIPQNQEYPTMKNQKGDLYREYTGLLKRLQTQSQKVPDMVIAIKENNKRSAAPPDWGVAQGPVPETNSKENGYGLPKVVSNGATLPLSAGNELRKAPPPIQPKPQALHGKALNGQSPTPKPTLETKPPQNDLAARLALLRSPKSPTIKQDSPVLKQDPRIRTQSIAGLDLPTTPKHSPSGSQSSNASTMKRPSGPREMPDLSPTRILSLSPLKTTMEVSVPGMPRPPAAIYSPSLSTDPATAYFPSSVPRSLSYLGNGINGSAPPISRIIRTPSVSEEKHENYSRLAQVAPSAGYSPYQPKPVRPVIDTKSETIMSGELVDYLKQGVRVLIVDIRPRDEFDDGHILAPLIICLEPLQLSLEKDPSGAQLEESMSLSPDDEQTLFEQRSQYDLVVFYDQKSVDLKSKVPGTQSVLQTFIRAVYDFGYEKQTKLPPKLLFGGLDAWIDLVGVNALKSSSTAGYSYKARKGSMSSTADTPRSSVNGDTHTNNNDTDNMEVDDQDPGDFSYYKTPEDFHRRFPDVQTVQESMTSNGNGIVRQYEYNHQDDLYSQPPARPPPALPRQRSSGISEKGPSTYAMIPGSGPATLTSPSRPRFITGLTNFGNSCYSNAVLQCLCATVDFRDYLLHFKYVPNSVPKRPARFGSAPDFVPSQETILDSALQQPVSHILSKLFSGMASGEFAFLEPRLFWKHLFHSHQAITGSHPDDALGGGQQQDCSEIYIFVIGRLEDELNKSRDKPDYSRIQLTDDNAKWKRSQMPLWDSASIEWKAEKETQQSKVANYFLGQKLIQYKCPNDDTHIHRTWESFNYLNLIINKSGTQSLAQVLRHNLGVEEIMDDEGRITCVPCGKGVTKMKKLVNLSYLPDYLVLYFQRFSNPGVSGKINTVINQFNSDSIDLTPYSAHDNNPPDHLKIPAYRGMVGPFNYECYGAVFHRGTGIGGGHYVAMARHLDQPGKEAGAWHHYNDRTVRLAGANGSQGPEYGEPRVAGGNGSIVMLFLRRKKL